MTRVRIQLRRTTTTFDAAPDCPGMRRLEPDDAERVGQLLYDAFHGGVDDEGETVADALEIVRALFASPAVHDLRLDASFVVERDRQIIAAVVTRNYANEPLISYLATQPAQRRRGLARHLVLAALNGLAESGDKTATLWVTETNEPALALYENLDFARVEARR